MTGPSPHPPLPPGAALPLKDALRGVRFTLRRTGALLAPAVLPAPPAGHGPGAVLFRGVERLAGDVSRVSSEALHRALDPNGGPAQSRDGLPRIRQSAAPELVFAAAACHGLDLALGRLGAEHLLASETLAAAAFRGASPQMERAESPGEQAALLIASMRRTGAVGAPPGLPLALSRRDRARASVALFAVMLWMLVDRAPQDEEEDELLVLCTDAAAAIEDRVLAAGRDVGRLAELLSAYAPAI